MEFGGDRPKTRKLEKLKGSQAPKRKQKLQLEIVIWISKKIMEKEEFRTKNTWKDIPLIVTSVKIILYSV